MSLSAYLWGIRLFTLFAFFAFFGVIIALDPKETGGRELFFVSLFALLTGILTLFVTGVYRKALGDVGAAHNFRQRFSASAAHCFVWNWHCLFSVRGNSSMVGRFVIARGGIARGIFI
jgi:hypothetical protein